jgi:hypothetical protein
MWLRETESLCRDLPQNFWSENLAALIIACQECQKRFMAKKRRFTVREDDLIQEALEEQFGPRNM